MRIYFYLLVLTSNWLALTPPLFAAERTPETFLLVIDTSFSMAPQKELLSSTLRGLIETGMNGQMKPGDKVNVWVFNRETNTRQFTPLEWRPENRAAVATAVTAFLKEQTFTRISRQDLAMVEIVNSLENRAPLTVLLFSDGFEFVWATTFDAQINGVYREHATRVRQDGKSFVTALRALDGVFVSSRVSILGDTLRLPELPATSPLAKIIQTPAEPKTTAPPSVPSQKEIAATPTPNTTLPPATAKLPTVPEPRIQAEPQPRVAPPIATAKVIPPPEPVVEPKRVVPAEVSILPKNDPPLTTAPPKIEVATPKPESTPKTAEPPPTAPVVNAVAQNQALPEKVVPPLQQTKAVEVSPVPAKESFTPGADTTATPTPAPLAAATQNAPPASSPTTASSLAEAAMLPPPAPETNRFGYVLVGCAGLLAAAWLAYFFLARRASEPTSSYITRSLDHKRK